MFLFDYPLDYEIVQFGDLFKDSEVNHEDGQWYYTSVPISYEFPDVKYEILEELFLPESVEEESGLKSATTKSFLYELEDEALKITGNYTEPEEGGDTPYLKAAKIAPSGTVQVLDTESGQMVGVEGVRVRTRKWFSYGYDWTNSNGYYRVDRGYRGDVHYCLFFENSSGFKIWATMTALWKAKHHVGKHNRRGYNFKIGTGSRAWRFCTVNNAVVKYRRYCSQMGIQRPHSNLRIAVLDRSGWSSAPMLRRTWGLYGLSTHSQLANFFLKANGLSLPANLIALVTKFAQPDLIISASSSYGTAGVYYRAFHELGHASHQTKTGSSYWVKYINYIITYGSKDNPYGNGIGHNAGYCGVGEMWGNYFGVFCLKKEYPLKSYDDKWKDEDWFNPGFLEDVSHISDITTSEIFSCLTSGTNTFSKLIAQLKTKTIYNEEVDNAFNNYTDWP